MKEKREDESWLKKLKEYFVMDPESDYADEDEELEQEKPWVTILTFVGLAVLAGIICFVLWQFSHPDTSEGEGGNADPGTVEDSLDSSELSGEEETVPDDSLSGQSSVSPEEPPEQDTGSSAVPEENGGSAEPDGNPDQGAAADQNGGTDGQEAGGQEQKPQEGTAEMAFAETTESVTPKDVVNLRSVPATADDGTIVIQVQNGEVLTRTGINQDTGWSRIAYGDQILYAVSQYLTTDLDYKTPVQASNPNRVSTVSGRIILFSDCDDWITPKEYVNLRTEPSTTEGDSTVSCQLNNGEKAHRTGYSTDSGWSRVEYNGQVLYVVTSLMYVTEP